MRELQNEEIVPINNSEGNLSDKPYARLNQLIEASNKEAPKRIKLNTQMLERQPLVGDNKTVAQLIEAGQLKADVYSELLFEWHKYHDGWDWWVIGQVYDQRPHGVARIIRADGQSIREGQFEEGKLHGYGRDIWANECYEGDFVEGKKNGQGTEVDKYGTYVGSWVNHQRHGPGKFTKADGTVHQGEFVNDKLNGVPYARL